MTQAMWRDGYGRRSGHTPPSAGRRGSTQQVHSPFPAVPLSAPVGQRPNYLIPTPTSGGRHQAGWSRPSSQPRGMVDTPSEWGRSDAHTPRTPQLDQHAKSITDQVLRDLIDRFLGESRSLFLTTAVNVMLCIEEAYWAYYDEFCTPEAQAENEDYKLLPSFEQGLLADFTYEVLCRRPQLQNPWPDLPQGGDEPLAMRFHRHFCEYKRRVPTAGAVILNKELDKVLLVKSACTGAPWTFPKGKCQREDPDDPELKLEAPIKAAVREVKVQAGVDITPLTGQAELHETKITRRYTNMSVTLFIVVLPADAPKPCKQNEASRIAAVEWHDWSRLDAAARGQPQEKGDMALYEVVTRYVHKLSPRIELLRERARNASGFDVRLQREQMLGELQKRWPELTETLNPHAVSGSAVTSASRRQQVRQELEAMINRTTSMEPGARSPTRVASPARVASPVG
eukprot:TRINITY_DN8898_c0_g1_i1.p1 TRINITY_DN8898_c0_g1~~TRINITY_DN8898_c0_g1_i1.p1  ORF type:complete len:455 (+),score=77.04 TRINITY_DN8898_c0_g1_i1:46-1410(+)